MVCELELEGQYCCRKILCDLAWWCEVLSEHTQQEGNFMQKQAGVGKAEVRLFYTEINSNKCFICAQIRNRNPLTLLSKSETGECQTKKSS